MVVNFRVVVDKLLTIISYKLTSLLIQILPQCIDMFMLLHVTSLIPRPMCVSILRVWE